MFFFDKQLFISIFVILDKKSIRNLKKQLQ
jgi:hypothetical protein